MRILIIGATGLLGRVLLEEWDSARITGTGSSDADIRDREQVQRLFTRVRPDCAILAAAYTDVDGCEKDPERAYQVNRDGAINVAHAARDLKSRLIFVSTDYVFDGSKTTPYEPEDPVCPVSVYGRSKAEAEAHIREILPGSCIVRTAWVFGGNKSGFASTMVDLAATRKKLSAVDDQRGCPTFNRDLARAIRRLSEVGAEKILHVTNSGDCSRYEFAAELVKAAGMSGVILEAVRTDMFPRPARRPKYSVLSHKGLDKYGVVMRHWKNTLDDYFHDRASQMDGRNGERN